MLWPWCLIQNGRKKATPFFHPWKNLLKTGIPLQTTLYPLIAPIMKWRLTNPTMMWLNWWLTWLSQTMKHRPLKMHWIIWDTTFPFLAKPTGKSKPVATGNPSCKKLTKQANFIILTRNSSVKPQRKTTPHLSWFGKKKTWSDGRNWNHWQNDLKLTALPN